METGGGDPAIRFRILDFSRASFGSQRTTALYLYWLGGATVASLTSVLYVS